jgi:hypothetical protein
LKLFYAANHQPAAEEAAQGGEQLACEFGARRFEAGVAGVEVLVGVSSYEDKEVQQKGLN